MQGLSCPLIVLQSTHTHMRYMLVIVAAPMEITVPVRCGRPVPVATAASLHIRSAPSPRCRWFGPGDQPGKPQLLAGHPPMRVPRGSTKCHLLHHAPKTLPQTRHRVLSCRHGNPTAAGKLSDLTRSTLTTATVRWVLPS